MFPESDRYEGTGRSPDDVLSESSGGVGSSSGMACCSSRQSRRRGHACNTRSVCRSFAAPAVQTEDPFFRATSAVCNIPTLTAAAQASGFLNAAPDPDGILRRAPLLMQYGDRVYPALSLAAVRSVTDARNLVLRIANVNTASLGLDGQDVPLDGKSNLLLRYRGGEAHVPVHVRGGRAERTGRSRRVPRSHRLRGHHRTWHTRGRGDAARYPVRRRRGPGDRGGQPAAARLHVSARARRHARDAGGDRPRHDHRARRRALRSDLGRDRRHLVRRRRVDRIAVAAGHRWRATSRRSIRRWACWRPGCDDDRRASASNADAPSAPASRRRSRIA